MKIITEYPEEIKRYCNELGVWYEEEDDILSTNGNCLTRMSVDRQEEEMDELPWACLLRNRT